MTVKRLRVIFENVNSIQVIIVCMHARACSIKKIQNEFLFTTEQKQIMFYDFLENRLLIVLKLYKKLTSHTGKIVIPAHCNLI